MSKTTFQRVVQNHASIDHDGENYDYDNDQWWYGNKFYDYDDENYQKPDKYYDFLFKIYGHLLKEHDNMQNQLWFQSGNCLSNLNLFVYWEMNSRNFCNKFPKLIQIS